MNNEDGCSICGKPIEDGQLAAMDLDYIDTNGVVHGKHFHVECFVEDE